MAIADIRYTGQVDLSLDEDSARLTGEVSITIDEVLEPVYVMAEDGTEQGDEFETQYYAPTMEDGAEQGDEFSELHTTQAYEDGAEQGEEDSSLRIPSYQDGAEQGDEFSVISFDTIGPFEDAQQQGDVWATLVNITVEDAAEQGDEWSLQRVGIYEAGAEQSDEFVAFQSHVVTYEDGAEQGDEWSLLGLHVLLFEDGAEQGDGWEVAGLHTLFVVNADTGAVSRYQFGEAINGAAVAEDGLLLSARSGLYALDASTDVGVAITWSLDTGFSKLGNEYLKQLDYIDVLGRFENPPRLQVVSNRYGTKQEDVYVMPTQDLTAYRDGRIKIGRWTKSVFYSLGLTGTGPAEIESVQVDILSLSRRR
jgi:ribosomal protein S16